MAGKEQHLVTSNPEGFITEQHYSHFKGDLSTKLEFFHTQKLGRAIVRLDHIEGYILPINEKQSSHLIIFGDGNMAITESWPDGENSLQEYHNEFGRAIHSTITSKRNSEDILGELLSPSHSGRVGAVGKIVVRNTRKGKTEHFVEAANSALDVARQHISDRRRVMMESTDSTLNVLWKLMTQE